MQTFGSSPGSVGASYTFFGRGAIVGAGALAAATGVAVVVAKPTFGPDAGAETVANPIGRAAATGCIGVLEAGIGIAVVGEGALACAAGCVACAAGCVVAVARIDEKPPTRGSTGALCIGRCTGTGSSTCTGEGWATSTGEGTPSDALRPPKPRLPVI